jgi:shikimate dehydrogenase
MRLFGLIGFPLTHSFSSQYFKKKFDDENIQDTAYQLHPLEDISMLPSLIHQHTDILGLNVTLPFKVSVLPYLDAVVPEATAVGAVNCIKIDRNVFGITLTGHNTDVYGFRESLQPALKSHHTDALVLGTGGASKAVCFALKQLGIHFKLVSRSGNEGNVLSYSQLNENVLNKNLLIINTTPVGMYPESENYPDIPYKHITDRHLLFDLIYNPAETRFLKLGSQAGAATLNGLHMLELQAEKSWEIWNE